MNVPGPDGCPRRPASGSTQRLIRDVLPETGRQTRHRFRRRREAAHRLDLQTLEPRLALAADVRLVADLNDAPRHSFAEDAIRAFAEIGDILVFAADDGVRGTELWRTDGTDAGTFLLRDIRLDDVVEPSGGPASRLRPGSRPTEFFVAGSTLYFSADDGFVGRELWRTDGTAAGTVLVSDIATGPDDSRPGGFAALGSTVLFVASRIGNMGLERNLWLTDGTASGTVPLDADGALDILAPRLLTTLGDTVFFAANDTEVWRTDGTIPGTLQLHAGTGTPSGLFALGDRLLFTADVPNGRELWVVEAGADEAVLLATFARTATADGAGDEPSFVVVPGTTSAVFTADEGANGSQLWRTDGTAAGTTRVLTINPAGSAAPRAFAAVGNFVYFQADDGMHGAELWQTDGTAAGTTLVRDIHPGPIGSFPEHIAALDGVLHFSAAGSGTDAELWRSDGTDAGTMLVRDIFPAGASRPAGASGRFVSVGGRLLFTAEDGLHGVELWRTDGTADGTTLVRDISPSTADAFPLESEGGSGSYLSAAVFDGTLYFGTTFTNPAGFDGTVELWKREGDGEPQRLLTIGSETGDPGTGDVLLDTRLLAPAQFTRSGDLVYFTSSRLDTEGFGILSTLWRTDGTPAGTFRLHDDVTSSLFDPGGRPSRHFVDLEGTLLFAGRDPEGGMELWRTDGTAAGTTQVADINPLALGSDPGQFVRFGSVVLFAADDGAVGRELWVTDGTPQGTSLVADIAPGTSADFGATGSDPTDLTIVGSFVVFAADDGIRGRELWRTDGTASGTALVKDIAPGVDDSFGQSSPASGAPSGITSFGTVAYFQADDGLIGRELWRTDGTPAGTVLVKDLDPTSASFGEEDQTFPRSGAPVGFVQAGDRVYFAAFTTVSETVSSRLWFTDGTPDGTMAVPEPDANRITRRVGRAVALGEEVLFAADLAGTDSASPRNRVLVRSDGTPAGTAIVELGSGRTGSWAEALVATADRAYFAIDDGTVGKELWQYAASAAPPPFATVSLDRTVLKAGETATVTFTLTSPGTSFGPEAVRVVNGTLSAFTGSGSFFTALFTPTPAFSGTATIEVPAGAFTNEAGSENTATPPLPLLVDTRLPGVAIFVDADDLEPLTPGRTATLTFVLSESATDFTAADITIQGRGSDDEPVAIGTLTDFSGSGTTYAATFSPAPGVVGTATIRVAAGTFTDAAGNPNIASVPALITVDTRPPVPPAVGAVATGIDGRPRVWAREFAFTAVGPTRIRIPGLPAGPARFFGPRGSVALAADGVAEPLSARITSRRYQAAARVLLLDLDTPLPVDTTTGWLTVGTAARPAARLLDAETGTVLREISGSDLVTAGHAPAFAARYQGGLRVAAGDADGDGTVDLAVAPGGLPIVGRATHAVTHGADIHRITIFNGTAGGEWSAASVDVAAFFGVGGESGYVIALGDVIDDADGGLELVVAAGGRIAVFDIVTSPAGPRIDPEPVVVTDLATRGTITSIATGAVFDDPLADIVVASTTGTDRLAGSTTVSILSGPALAVRHAFAAIARVESGPGRRLVDVFAHGATVAVGDFDGDARRDLAIGAGPRGLGNFRVLANAFVTAAAGTASAAAIADQFGPAGRFAQARLPGAAWKPLGGPDYFTPGEVPQPMGLGFNAPVMVAVAAGAVPSTGGRSPLFVALGVSNQTGNRIRRFAFAGPNAWGIDGEFSQRSASASGPFAPGLGLRLG